LRSAGARGDTGRERGRRQEMERDVVGNGNWWWENAMGVKMQKEIGAKGRWFSKTNVRKCWTWQSTIIHEVNEPVRRTRCEAINYDDQLSF
jgi:hypothetical protein